MFGISPFAQAPFATLATNTYLFSVFEDIAAADTSAQLSALLQATTENLVITDENSQGSIFYASVNEVLDIVDNHISGIDFTVSNTEGVYSNTIAAIGQGYFDVMVEPMTVSDSQAVYFAALNTITEAITSSDSTTQISTFQNTIVETLVANDLPSIQAAYISTITEPVSGSSTLAIAATFQVSKTENVILDTDLMFGTAYFLNLEESAQCDDASAASVIVLFTFIESLRVNEFFLDQTNFHISYAENAGINDPFTYAGWTKILDTQNPAWTLINDSQ